VTTGQHPEVVLVTGVCRYLGAQVAVRLAADPRIRRVIGLDAHEPSAALAGPSVPERFEFVATDIRTAEPAAVIASANVDTVVHLAVASGTPAQSGGRAAMKEQNVIGTMQLLAACQQAPRVRRLVLRSSTAAYGASFSDPAVFTEQTEPREMPRGGFARDVLDMEGYVRGFRRRRPDTTVTVLRFAPFIGAHANTSLTRYFAQPVVPTVFGRDPRLQFVHVDDALEILYRSAVEDHQGTFNVAGPGVITLSQAVRRSGRVAVPVPEGGMSALAGLTRGMGWGNYTLDQLDLFVHGRVVDTAALVSEFDFEPRPTPVAFEEFIGGTGRGGILPADAIGTAERVVLDGLRRARTAIRMVAGDG
jgi:UDP-glucose 4-epimerase